MDIMRSRGKIIDATLELVQTSGFDGVTIAAVAESAGVSRQTVYSIFGTREDLVSQSVAHLTLMAMEDIQAHAAATDNPTDFLIELVMAGRHFARTTPVLKAMFQADQGNPLFDEGVIRRAKPVGLQFLSPLKGQVRDIEDLAELMVHLSLSVVLFDDRPDKELRQFLRRWLDPMVASIRIDAPTP